MNLNLPFGSNKKQAKQMRKILIAGCAFAFIVIGCSPATATTVIPTDIPTAIPTLVPRPVVENPPACWGADLIYHTQLQQMLLVNCVEDPSQETPGTIWGWNGTHWQKVAEGGPSGRILGGAAY